ncbi:MAG TPA: CBS domain-containing protein [Candidatus Nitrosotenuis sp.]|jgi:predicted transcriptional regulator|nr:CBS domain-containing protein [Candidatus Nitrosotenuis sp.]
MKTVKDIMQSQVISATPDMTVKELAHLLTQKTISGVPVVDSQGQLLGVVSLSDLAAHIDRSHPTLSRPQHVDTWYESRLLDRFVIEDFEDQAVARDIMTPAVYQIEESATLEELAEMMAAGNIHRVIVTRQGKMVGIVSTMDMVRALLDLLRQSRAPR